MVTSRNCDIIHSRSRIFPVFTAEHTEFPESQLCWVTAPFEQKMTNKILMKFDIKKNQPFQLEIIHPLLLSKSLRPFKITTVLFFPLGVLLYGLVACQLQSSFSLRAKKKHPEEVDNIFPGGEKLVLLFFVVAPQMFFYVHANPWGNGIQFDGRIFCRWVADSTTK